MLGSTGGQGTGAASGGSAAGGAGVWGGRGVAGHERRNAPPNAHRVYERHLAFAQMHLDEAAWQAAWAEGHAMTLEQAVAYALEQVS